jgi:hypothetical protein
MKYLFSILLIIISINCIAQHSTLKRVGLFTLAITTDAIGDALNDEGNKELGHAFDAASVGTHIYMLFDDNTKFNSFRELAIGTVLYTGIRFAIFNLTYNLVRGLPYNYVGTTDFIDKNFSQLNSMMFPKMIVLTFVISLDFNER